MSSVLAQKKSTRGGRVRVRRWLWATLLVLLAAFIALLCSPLAVRFALRFVQIPGYTLKASEVGGSLWRPELRGVDIRGPGLKGRAESIALNYDLAALTRQELKFSLSLSDAQLELDPSKLAAPPSSAPTTGGGTAWKILPQSLKLQRVTVKVRGAPYTLPDGTVSLNSLEGKGNTGVADLRLNTQDGQAQAKLRYALEPLNFTADFQGDAALANHWWPGIQAGTVTGQYRFKNDALEGEVQVAGGLVQIPGLEKLTLSNLSGQVTHRGSVVGFTARGQSYGGPLDATGSVDYQKQRWNVRGTVKPQLEPLFASLAGVRGVTGQPTVQVTASGWTTARVRVQALGNSAFAGVPIPRVDADYTFKGGKSTLAVKGDLRALGEAQTAKISLESATGKVWNGTGQLEGRVLGAPVNATARLAGNTLSTQGEVLSSAVDAVYDLKTGKVEGNWNGLVPYLKNSILQGSFAGPLERLEVQVSKLEADLPGLGRRSYRGTGYAGTRGYGLDLGVAKLDLSPELSGKWQVRRFALPQNILATGAGKLDLKASTLEGTASLGGLPLGILPLSGPLSLDWKRSRADWNTGRADLRWTGKALEATLENLSVQAGQTVRLSGPLRLDLSTQNLSARVEASTNGGQATLEARGRTLGLKGNFRGFALAGQGDLDTLRATLEGRNKNLVVRANYDKTLEFTALSGANLNSSASGTFDIAKGLEGLKAQGNFDLSALESFGFKGLQGVVNARANGERITARAKYQGFDISANGNLKNLTAQLEATRKNLKVTAYYNKTLEFTTLSGLSLNSRAAGNLDPAKGLTSLRAQGSFDLAALESFGIKGLEGVVSARANGEQITARAKYQGFDIQANGNLKNLTAQFEAKRKSLKLTANYDKTLEFMALSGAKLDSSASGTFNIAKGLAGLKAQGNFDLSALESFGIKGLEGVVDANANGETITARAKYQGLDISASGNLKNLTAQLEANQKNLKVIAKYDKTLEFTALSGKNLDSRTSGNVDLAKGLEGLKAQGDFDLGALESFGFKGLEGVVSARANGETIIARAKYQGFDISANGNLKNLTAQLKAQGRGLKFVGRYDKTLMGTLSSGKAQKLAINWSPENGFAVKGSLALEALKSFGLQAKGTLALEASGVDLASARGTGRVNGEAYGARVSGNLRLASGRVTAQLNGDYGGAQAKLSGQLYPRVQAAGTLEYRFQGLLERASAQLSGEYGALRFAVKGVNAPRTVSGVKIASQTLALEGQLTPNRYAKGSWGDLNLEYNGKKVLFAGRVPLEYSGSALTLRARGDWQPDFAGSLQAILSGPLEGETATLELAGPWKALELRGNWPRYATQLRGQAALPDLSYSATVTAKVQGYGLNLNAKGKGTNYALEGFIKGDEGGVLRLSGRDQNTWSARAEDFQTRGAHLSGQLENGPTGLNGSLEARVQDVPVTLEIRQNRLTARGNYSGVKGTLEALLDLNKLEARAVNIGLEAPQYGTVQAKGQYVGGKAALTLSGNAPGYGVFEGQARFEAGKAKLEGTLNTLSQAFDVGGQNLGIAPQSARVSAAWDGKTTRLSLTDAQNSVLELKPEGLRGGFTLPYSLSGVAGRVTLTADQNYFVKLSGPLEGQVSADAELQKFSATLEAQLSSLNLGALGLPRDLKLGRLALNASGNRSSVNAKFELLDSDYKGLPLAVSGSGALELGDKLGLRNYNAQLTGDLKPFTALLPVELRSSTSLSALEVTVLGQMVQGQESGVSATYKLLGSEYASAPLKFAGRASLEKGKWTVRGDLSHPQLGAQLEARGDGLVLSGLRADIGLLEPYLKQNLSGSLNGTLVLPAYDLSKAQGVLSGTVQRGADSLSGAVNAAGGVWSVNLLGTALEKPLRIQGNLYPRASATLRWDGLTGQFEGQLEGDTQRASARVRGRTLGRSVDLSATYTNNALSVAGLVDGVRLSANARLEDGIKGTFQASALDLRPLTGLAGNLELVASFENLEVKGTARGTVAGYAVDAPLEYTGGKLNVVNGSLEGLLSAGRSLEARTSGEVYPMLKLSGNASLNGDFPLQTTFKVGGDYGNPKVTARGALEAAQITLGPDYRLKTGRVPFTATLENNQISAGFEGTGVSGSAKATLEGGLKVLSAGVRLSGVALEGQGTAVTANGTLEWTPVQGLGANLNASGTVLGQAAILTVGGTGALELAGSLGEGRFNATLGRDILERPSGTVALERVDLSRFWGRPGALGVNAKLELGGTYTRPEGTLSGTLEDARGVLSGTLSGQVTALNARVNLAGAKIQGWGFWDANAPAPQAWSARVTALGADVSHLLPPHWNYGAVWLGGNLNLTPTSLEVKGLDVRVENTDLGVLRAIGDLSWAGNEPVGKLQLEGLGGNATLEGRLSEGAKLSVNALDLSRWQVGRVSGSATVRGALENPTLEGLFKVAGRYAKGDVQVSGRVQDPQISAKGDLLEGVKGPFEAQLSNLTFSPLGARVSLKTTLTAPVQGNLALEAQDFNLSKLTARVKLTADLSQAGNTLQASLSGVWPALEGSALVKVGSLETPVKVVGQGNGNYTLEAGTLGSGTLQLNTALEGTKELLPRIRASLTLEPLSLLPAELRKNLKGSATTKVTFEGDPLKPSVALEGNTRALEYAGVRLSDVTVKGAGTLENWTDFSKLSVALEQGRQNVGRASLGGVRLEGLKASAFSSELSLSGTYGAKGADFNLSSAGQLSGKVGATLVNEVLSADYDLGYGAYGASGKVRTQLSGARALSGNGSVRGLPADLVEGPLVFALGGTLNAPTLRSSLNLLGAGAKLEAGLTGASLELSDGPQTKARGTLTWNAGKSANPLSGPLSGEFALERKLTAGVLSDPISGNLKLSGTLEKPQVKLGAQYRDVSLSGDGSLEQGQVQLKTRTENGTVSWQGQTVTSDVRGFDLSSLNLPGYSGLLELVGSLDLARQKGKLTLNLEGVKTPITIPYLDLALAGSAQGTLELAESARLSLKVQTPAGTVDLTGNNPRTAGAGGWRGQAQVDLKAPKGGTVKGTVTLENGALENGTLGGQAKPALGGVLVAKGVQLNLADTPLSVDGTVGFSGQNFTLSGLLEAGGGKLGFKGDGAVADFVPALSAVGLTQSENGYQVRATLDSVNLKNVKLRGLKLPDYLEGRVSGSATFAESVSTFTLRSEALTLAGEELPARLEGTFSGGNLRLRGAFGDSSAVGNVTDGQLSARIELIKTPLHAIIGAFSGPLPGKSYATGAVRYRGRLDNLLGGQLEAVAENLSVEGGSQALRGSGQLEYARGILKIPNISLSGAGKVQIRGEYSPEKVDFTADFVDASFTPLLKLIPALKTLEPSLKGTVQVRIGGSFEQPSAVVRTQNLEGSFAGIAVKSSDLSGELRGNLLELGGHLSALSAFTADGVVSAKANLSVQGVSNAQVIFTGKGKIDNFGPLEGVKATLLQSAGVSSTGAGRERWTVQASGKQGGTLTVAGEVAPRLALEFSGQGVTPVVGALFIKGSVLNTRGKLERLTGDEAALPLNSSVPSSNVSPAISSPNSATDSSAVNIPTPSSASNPFSPALTARRDRYRLSGAVDFSSLLLGAVATPATAPDPNAPKTPGGSNFVSPLPDELTTFPRAKAVLKRSSSFLEQLEFDNFDLNASRGGVKVDENLARAEFAGRLTLSGTGSAPRLEGKLVPVRGSVFLRENEFVLDNSSTYITFDPAEGFYPRILLNARALGKVKLQTRDVTLKVQVRGDFITQRSVTVLEGGSSEAKEEKKLQLDTTLATDTGINCSSTDLGTQCGELYALLATGSSDLANLTGNLTQSALKTAVNVFVIGELERGIARALNLSVFRIRTNALDFGSDFKADFTVGTYLTKEFYLQYQVDLQGNGLLDAKYTTDDGKFTFSVNTPIQWLDLSKAKPTFGLSYNLDLDPRSSLQFGVQTGSKNGNELKLLLNYKFSF